MQVTLPSLHIWFHFDYSSFYLRLSACQNHSFPLTNSGFGRSFALHYCQCCAYYSVLEVTCCMLDDNHLYHVDWRLDKSLWGYYYNPNNLISMMTSKLSVFLKYQKIFWVVYLQEMSYLPQVNLWGHSSWWQFFVGHGGVCPPLQTNELQPYHSNNLIWLANDYVNGGECVTYDRGCIQLR